MKRTQHTPSYCRWQHSLTAGTCPCVGAFAVGVQTMRPVSIRQLVST